MSVALTTKCQVTEVRLHRTIKMHVMNHPEKFFFNLIVFDDFYVNSVEAKTFLPKGVCLASSVEHQKKQLVSDILCCSVSFQNMHLFIIFI